MSWNDPLAKLLIQLYFSYASKFGKLFNCAKIAYHLECTVPKKNRSVSVSGNCGAAKWVYSQNVRVIWAIIHQLGISNKTNVTKTLFAISRSYAPPADVVATPNVGLVVALNAIVIVLYRVNDWHYNLQTNKFHCHLYSCQ